MTADHSAENTSELTPEELQLVLDAANEGIKLEMAFKQLTSAYLDHAPADEDANAIFQRMRESRVHRALVKRGRELNAMLLDIG